MGIYLSLTAIVILLAGFANNCPYVKKHIEYPTREISTVCRRNRQQTVNIVVATAIFLLIAAVSTCRIAVGNDYWVYREQFNLIMQRRHVSFEWGFNGIVWMIQSIFGYDKYIPVFAFFSITTCCFFVKAIYNQAEWFAASVFLLMTGGYYFSSLNSVRYYFVLAIALYAMKYVLRKEYGKFILWIAFAALFHKSILVVIPVYIFARWLADRRVPKLLYVLGGVFVASLLLFKNIYREIIFFFYPFYRNSAFDNGDISITNIAKCVGVLVLAFLWYKVAIKDNVQNRFYLFLNIGGLVIYTFGSFIPEISRIGYYLICSQIFLIPGILIRIPAKKWRIFFTFGTACAFLGYFAFFLHSAYDVNIRILPYLNWIFN